MRNEKWNVQNDVGEGPFCIFRCSFLVHFPLTHNPPTGASFAEGKATKARRCQVTTGYSSRSSGRRLPTGRYIGRNLRPCGRH